MKLTIDTSLTKLDIEKIKECKDGVLDISRNLLSSSQITYIFQALTSNPAIKKLILNSVQFDNQARNQFVKEMQNNLTITELNICDTPQLTVETGDMRFPITDILEKNKLIQKLWIGNDNNSLMHALVLKLFMNTQLTFLNINYISLTIEGLKGVSKYLQTSTLNYLQLQNLKIKNTPGEGEDCALILRQAIKQNTSLRNIELTNLQFLHEDNEKLTNSILDEAAKKNPNFRYSSPIIFSPKFWRVSQCSFLNDPKTLTPSLLQLKQSF